MMPGQASAMFAQNMLNLVRHIAKKEPSSLLANISKELAADESGDMAASEVLWMMS